jgi:hypothetical protein
MAGSIKQARKGLRPGSKSPSQPVTQHQGAGSKPKSMTAGKARPASTWFKSTQTA